MVFFSVSGASTALGKSVGIVKDDKIIMHNISKANAKYIGNAHTLKFHTSSCPHAHKIKNKVYFNSRDEAIKKGYKPCKHCQP